MNVPKILATARCGHCGWAVEMTATPQDCQVFLEGLLMAHCHEAHPDLFPPSAVLAPVAILVQ